MNGDEHNEEWIEIHTFDVDDTCLVRIKCNGNYKTFHLYGFNSVLKIVSSYNSTKQITYSVLK